MSHTSFRNEAFRFVTLRNPQALNPAQRQEKFIRYGVEAVSGSLYATLIGILAESESTNAEKLRDIQLAAANYLKGELAFVTWQRLEAYIPEIATISMELSSKGRSVKPSDLLALWSLTGITEEDLTVKVWDTLIAANVLGGHLYTGEALECVLKMLHITAMSPESTEAQQLNRLHAHIVLPSTIFPLPKVKAETPTPETVPPAKDKDPHKATREKYEAALQEIRKYRSRKWIFAERNTGTQQGENPTPYVDVEALRETDISSFSEDTQAVLEELNLVYPCKMPALIELLILEIRAIQPNFGVAGKRVISVGGAIWEENANLVYKGDGPLVVIPTNPPKPIGVADLRIVEQELCCYKGGEIAHTEPVLYGETKERSTRRLDKVESFESTTVEKSKQEERDNQSTERYDLESESSKTASKDLSINAGMNLSASYGPVSLGVNTGFAFNSSSQVSNSESISIAKEVTQRAVKRISESIKTERSTKTTFEFEEYNLHKLENKGTGNVTGIYHWLDKYYKCRVRNYGKRTMYEFLIPRPAAFHIAAMSSQEAQSVAGIIQPIDPRSDAFNTEYGHQLNSIQDITETNYTVWASLMGIEIAAPPKANINICYGFSGADVPPHYKDAITQVIAIRKFASTSSEITIPDGYKPIKALVEAHFTGKDEYTDGHITITIGNSSTFVQQSGTAPNPITLYGYEQGQPLYVNAIGWCNAYEVGLNIEMERLDSHLAAWQMKVYNQIVSAYEQKKAQYEMALKSAKTKGGVEIKGTNPLINREIEQTELKKWCMMHLFPVGSVPGHPYDPEFSSWAMQMWSDLTPFFFAPDAVNDGKRVVFAETVFEWDNMIYQFFPYYWSPEHYWKEIYSYQDTDPLFQKFMQAGYARVVVPVKPGFEAKVASFFATGIIPESSTLVYDEETLAALLEDMQDIPDPDAPDNIENFTWEVKVPTTLVVLQAGSGCLGDEGLPCFCDTVFTENTPPPKPFQQHTLLGNTANENEAENNNTPTN